MITIPITSLSDSPIAIPIASIPGSSIAIPIASLSGSLWFDGFSDYPESFPPSPGVKRVFLSLGDREKNTKNPRMATVEDNTRRILSLLTARGVPAALEMNPGGHFNDVPQRIARGIQITLT